MSALMDRDHNVAATAQQDDKQGASGAENQPQGAQQQQKSVVGQSVLSNENEKHYVSPSDNIMSPASQKLTSFKQRQIGKQGAKNPAARTLFARTASGSSGGFDDIDTAEKKA